MSGSFNLLNLGGLNRRVEQSLRIHGGAYDEGLKASSVILAKSIRKILGVRGGGAPSRPGEAPRKQRGILAKSVSQGAAGAGRIVAVQRFTAAMLEQGVNTSLPVRSGRKGRPGGKAKRTLAIAARPFMATALRAVEGEMARAMTQKTSSSVQLNSLGGPLL